MGFGDKAIPGIDVEMGFMFVGGFVGIELIAGIRLTVGTGEEHGEEMAIGDGGEVANLLSRGGLR